ncbi:MAG: Rrf2 family transcriptional regulator [Calditrichia bacterium]
MIRFSKKVEYALIALLYMSNKDSQSLTTARELAVAFNLSQDLIGKILQRLAKGEYITSVQGVKGGYRLNRSLDRINVNEILALLDGPIRIVNCMETGADSDCDQLHVCDLRPTMGVIQKKLEQFFDTLTMKDLKDELREFDQKLWV